MTPLALTALTLAGLSPCLMEMTPLASPSAVQEKAPKAQEASDKDAVDPDEAKSVWEYLSGRYDANGDGKIDKKEYTRGSTQFDRLDKDKNGFIEKADSAGTQGRGERGGGRRGGGGGRRGARGGGGGGQSAPTEGSRAPSFELETLYPVQEEGEAQNDRAKASDKEPEYKSVSLKTFKDKKPVALIFGSYT